MRVHLWARWPVAPPVTEGYGAMGPKAALCCGMLPYVMNASMLAAGALRGVAGAMSMTGARTLAAELGLLDQGTPPERMADKALAPAMAAVPEGLRPAVVDLLHLGYGALGGVIYVAVLPVKWRRHWISGPVFGSVLWLVYNAGLVPVLRLHDQPRRPHEVAILAADHVLYGLTIGQLGGPAD
jgi:hypothetical protein